MTELDFNELSAVWKAEVPGEVPRELSALSARAIRRAKIVAMLEMTVTVAVVVCVLLTLWHLNARRATLVGAVVIGTVVWSTWDRHRLRRIEWSQDERQRDTALAHDVDRLKAKMQRTTTGILLFPLSLLLGLFFAGAAEGDTLANSFSAHVRRAFDLTRPLSASLVALIVLIMMAMARSAIRQRREIRRLNQILASYRGAALADHTSSS